MRVSTAQIAQLVAQSLQGAKESGTLELKVGSIVRATLLEILGESDAMIQVGAYKLRAKLDAELQPGDQVTLLVTGEQKRGAMELKLVNDPLRNNGSPQSTLDVHDLVKALGLPDQEDSKAVVQEWVSRQLPLKPDVLQAASDVLRQLPKLTPAQVATVGKMAELGIPIQQGTFAAMDALENGPKLHELLSAVQTVLADVLPETSEEPATGIGQTHAASVPAQPIVAENTRSLPSQPSVAAEPIAAEPSTPSADPAHVSGQNDQEQSAPPASDRFPENKIPRQGTTASATVRPQFSAELTQTLGQLGQVVRELLSDASGAQSLGDKAKRLGLGFEEQLGQAVRRLPTGSDEAALRAAVHAATHVDPTEVANLKQTLLQVQAATADLQAAGLGQLVDDVGQLLQNVTGQQLMQTPGQERSDLMYQFTAVPTRIGDRQQTVELHVMSRKGPQQKTLDPANCYVLFHLEMPNLGELDIHLHIVDKVVGVRFISETAERVQISSDDQRELWAAIRSVGFHLGALKVEEKVQPAAGAQLPLLPPVLTQGALDLRL